METVTLAPWDLVATHGSTIRLYSQLPRVQVLVGLALAHLVLAQAVDLPAVLVLVQVADRQVLLVPARAVGHRPVLVRAGALARPVLAALGRQVLQARQAVDRQVPVLLADHQARLVRAGLPARLVQAGHPARAVVRVRNLPARQVVRVLQAGQVLRPAVLQAVLHLHLRPAGRVVVRAVLLRAVQAVPVAALLVLFNSSLGWIEEVQGFLLFLIDQLMFSRRRERYGRRIQTL